jgi:hypothetical protein
MPHNYPRKAFLLSADGPGQSNLASLYSRLVAIELALKDEIQSSTGNWIAGHDIPNLIAPHDTSLSTQLASALSNLRCTHRDGSNVSVSSAVYPSIRYLRHQSDFPTETYTDDAAVQAACDITLQCAKHLITIGIL